MHEVATGRYRGGPMQVVSGAIGRERVHYEAPPPERVPGEMDRFLAWFSAPGDTDGVLSAGCDVVVRTRSIATSQTLQRTIKIHIKW